MYTSYIGKHFVELYNKKKNRKYTPESFFEEVMFPLFFNDEQHLMHVGNSPFFQKPKKEDIEANGSKPLAQFANLKAKMESDIPNMSIFVGYGASDIYGTTSGQMTDLVDNEIDKNEMYASWIGQALAVGVSGGYVFLLKDDTLLWNLFYGWENYRKYLNQTPNLKDKQIETWNGNWLLHSISEKFDLSNPLIGFTIKPENVLGKIAIPTVSWSELFFYLSKFLKGKEIIINAYSLSRTNTTLGFFKVFLREVKKPIEYKHLLFDFKDFKSEVSERDIAEFETFYNFRAACQMGTIGLKALEPKGLRAFMPRGSVPFAQGNEFNFQKKESYKSYEIYQIWIMATLNKIQLLELASKTASILQKIEDLDERGKKQMASLSVEIRESRNVKQFIEGLAKVVDIVDVADKSVLREVVQETLAMPTDNYPLFITLIRFEYNYLKQ